MCAADSLSLRMINKGLELFTARSTKLLINIRDFMHHNVYIETLARQNKPALKRLGADIFKQNNDPKHTSVVKYP